MWRTPTIHVNFFLNLNAHWARCTHAGRECNGYAQDRRPQYQAVTQNHASISRYAAPSFSGFGDSIRYLEFYYHCAGPILSSKFDDFWSQTALQMAQSEPAVCHALVALGHLQKTEPGSLKHARAGFAAGSQHGTHLSHYNKAVKCLVDRMAEPSYPPEIALVTCLLFVCIEFLKGNTITSFMHLNNGLKIISERFNGSFGPSTTPQPLSTIRRSTSSSTTMIEDHLLPLFIRATTSALICGVPVEKIIEIPYPRQMSLLERPFRAISEAQVYTHELRNPTLLFARTMAQKLILREPITTEDIQHQTLLLECHHAWLRAVRIFESGRPLSKEDDVIVSSLKVQYYTTYIMLACGMEIPQTPYDAHISSFKAIIHHAKIIIDSMGFHTPSLSCSTIHSTTPPLVNATSSCSPEYPPRAAANFTFEVSLIPCLYLTAKLCRCPSTRREAVSLLSLNPPREGLWDAEQVVMVSKRIIEIEESEVDPATGWPAERTRLWTAVFDGNLDRNGGFWIKFAYANWAQQVRDGHVPLNKGGRTREDCQWEEWFVL